MTARPRSREGAPQPVAAAAAPDEIGADDEPDEQVERARPRRPREAVLARRLRDEKRRLREPAEANAPGRGAPGASGAARFAEVAHGRFAVEQEHRPKEKLSQPGRAPGRALPLRLDEPRARRLRARGAAASSR